MSILGREDPRGWIGFGDLVVGQNSKAAPRVGTPWTLTFEDIVSE